MKKIKSIPHEINSRNNAEISQILRSKGYAGIGIYWCFNELIYAQNGRINKADLKYIANMELGVDFEELYSIVCDYGLFDVDDVYVWVKGEKEHRENLKECRAMAAHKRWSRGKDSDKSPNISDDHSSMQNGNFAMQTEHFAMQNKDFAMQTENFAMQNENFALQNEQFAYKNDDLGSESDEFAPKPQNSDEKKPYCKDINSGNKVLSISSHFSEKEDKERCIIDTYKESEEKELFKAEEMQSEPVNFALILSTYNRICKSFPKLRILGEERRKKVSLRIDEMKRMKLIPLDALTTCFQKMEASPFLRGDKGKWKATFDWLFDNGKNWIKVWEGNYDETEQEKKAAIMHNILYHPNTFYQEKRHYDESEY